MQSSSVVTVTASIIMVTSIAVGFAIPFTTTIIITAIIITIITAGIITKITTTTTGATIIIIDSGGSYEVDGGFKPRRLVP